MTHELQNKPGQEAPQQPRTCENEKEEFCRIGEHDRPSFLWHSMSKLFHPLGHQRIQTATGSKGQDGGIDEAFDHLRLVAGKIVDTIAFFQLSKKKLHGPPGGVQGGNLLCAYCLYGDIRQIKVVTFCFLITDTDQTETGTVAAPFAPIQTMLIPYLHLKFYDLTPQTADDILQMLADEILFAADMHSGDDGVGAFLETGEEVSSVTVDPSKEAEAVITQIENQQSASDPWSYRECRSVMHAFACNLDFLYTATQDVYDGVKFGRSLGVVGPACGVSLGEQRVKPQDCRVDSEHVTECREHAVFEHVPGNKAIDDIIHKRPQELDESWRETVIEGRRGELNSIDQFVGSPQPCNGPFGSRREAQDEGPSESDDIYLPFSYDRTDLDGDLANAFFGEKICQRVPDCDTFSSGHHPASSVIGLSEIWQELMALFNFLTMAYSPSSRKPPNINYVFLGYGILIRSPMDAARSVLLFV